MSRIFLLTTICCSFLLAGCKKGKDDPAFSLLTRKARISGTWQLESGHLEYKGRDTGNADYTILYELTADGFSGTFSSRGGVTSFQGLYSLTLNIEKSGGFSMSETMAAEQNEMSGRWAFNSGVGDTRKKTDVYFMVNSVPRGSTVNVSLFNRFNTNFEYFIRELRNKKMVLETSAYLYINSNGQYEGVKGYFVFRQ